MNVMVVSPFGKGVLDVRWDDPGLIGANTPFNVVGVNVYRSDASDRGPFRRLNSYPVSGTFFRDYTDITLVAKEVIPWDGGWQSRGDAPNLARWTLKTRFPIFKPRELGVPGNAPADVLVTVDGVPARVVSVFGPSKEVTLDSSIPIDPTNDRLSPAPLPGPDSEVAITYYTTKNLLYPNTAIDRKVFYRVTTVAEDSTTTSGYVETPLSQTAPASDMQIEQLDYIWREAMRRNRWILEQGGERVKLFVQKVNGVPCPCSGETDPESRAFNKQPSNRCRVCYGTGFVGGFEGPYDILVAPDDAEKRISQTPNGRRKEHTYEVWMSFSPIVSQRDFILKQNNERYSIGPVRRPTNRGNVMQQHFNIAYLDPPDIRYEVPVDIQIASPNLPWPQTRYPYRPIRETYDRQDGELWPVTPDAVFPMATDKDNVANGVQIRWNSGTGENINY